MAFLHYVHLYFLMVIALHNVALAEWQSYFLIIKSPSRFSGMVRSSNALGCSEILCISGIWGICLLEIRISYETLILSLIHLYKIHICKLSFLKH